MLVNVSVGMTIGSVAAGMLLQRKTLDPTIIMACGALCVCFGIIATFPPPQIPVLYELAPILAFPGVLIASIGEPLVAIASLRVLYDLQVTLQSCYTALLSCYKALLSCKTALLLRHHSLYKIKLLLSDD